MISNWRIAELELRRALEAAGFTVRSSPLHAARDIEGEREIGNFHVHVAVDAAGRIRITTTRITDEAKLPALEAGGQTLVRVRVTEEVTTITGQIDALADLESILVALKLDR